MSWVEKTAMHHQFCNGEKFVGVNASQDTEELQDIWMGQGTPQNNLPAKPLERII